MKIKFIILIYLLITPKSQYSVINIVNYSPYPETIYFESINKKEIASIVLAPGEGISFERKQHPVLKRAWNIKYIFDAFKIEHDANPGEAAPKPTLMRVKDAFEGSINPFLTASTDTYRFTVRKLMPIGRNSNLTIVKTSIISTPYKPQGHYLNLNKP